MPQNTVIVAAKRAAIGSFLGIHAQVPPRTLGSQVVEVMLKDVPQVVPLVGEVVMGHVLQAGCGQNMARQIALDCGLDVSVPAYTVNQVCASGLRSVINAWQNIQLGQQTCIIAGGVESMSLSPHIFYVRKEHKMGNFHAKDIMLSDGLIDAFNYYHMGITAENVAKKYGISRQEQDAFALVSQKRATHASQTGRFRDEIIGDATDEHIRPQSSLESLAKLKPAFDSQGTVTAGNASGLNDGAAAVVLMSEKEAVAHKLTPLVTLRSWAQVGVDPAYMGLGPIEAVRRCLKRAGWAQDEVDLFELNEAFAAQSIAVIRELELDMEKVNVNGGAIALGHPLGASGTRILVTLIHEMLKRDAHKGIACLCVGGGMGIAVGVER